MVRGGRAEAPSCSDVSFRLDQKTGNFKVAVRSSVNQWSEVAEEKQKNQLANKKEFRFMKTIMVIIKGGDYWTCFSLTQEASAVT